MKMKFKNKTSEPQQINLIDGSAIKVDSLEETTIDSWNIYKEEKERTKIFFDVSFEHSSPVIDKDEYKELIQDFVKEDKPKRTYNRRKREEKIEEESEDINNFSTEE
jgi:ribosome-associated toxin RatA of RatAB toxin-antitoxin module